MPSSSTLGLVLSSEIRSSTRLSGSLNRGIPVASIARGPGRPRVSISRVSNLTVAVAVDRSRRPRQ
jgi:hypothetical protein